MKRHIGRAVTLIGILLLGTFAGATRAHSQSSPSPLVPTQNSLTALPLMHGPAIGEQFTELASGIFTYSKTDLSLPGPIPINITRVYRSEDETSSAWNNRAFGIGTRLNYDIFVYSSGNNEYVSMPDSSSLTCTPSGSEYVCNSEPSGVWFGSVINGSNLTRPDGTVYSFDPTTGLLLSISDRFTNSITISRGPFTENSACYSGSSGHSNSVPTGYVGTVSSSNNRAVYFCYDDPNNQYDITGIADNASGGPIKKVTYAYNTGSTLETVTQLNDSHAVTTYQYGQTSPYARGDITTIIVNDSCPAGGCGSPNQVYTYITYVTNCLGTALKNISSQLPGNGYNYVYSACGSGYPAGHVAVSLPDNATRDFYFDSAGYVTEDVRNVNAAKPEYTVFNRGQHEVGGSSEFVGEVDEEDLNQNKVRVTTYGYDANGNVTSVTLSPAPGQSSCCATSATWNYTYTTYNRLASAVEPLAYNGTGTTYSYTDSGCTHTMTVTDPVGNALTTTYNCQGQPTSIPNASGYYTGVQYYGNGDLESVADPIGNTTSYVTDADGRVSSVTSPQQETTQYSYDAIDDVTQVIDPLGNVTCNTYDLIGELASTTPPRGVIAAPCSNPNNIRSGYTTTIKRSPNLATTTLTDPLGHTTVTDLNGQGRKTDYTDKRGVETTYTYNKFGEVTEAYFNANNKSGYPQEKVDMSNYDPLDRVTQIADSLLGNTETFAYDSLDSVLSLSDTAHGGSSVSYTYDWNGRRTSMTPSWEPAVNYGYDCDDRLIGMSSNGTRIQSCSPTIKVTNGNYATQFSFYYLGTDVLESMLADGVLTFDSVIDNDGRVLERDYIGYRFPFPEYGSLTYSYDNDGHVIDKGGSLAAVNLPAAWPAVSYSATDQLSTWNGYSTDPDNASNITNDPASGLTLTWSARNQAANVGGFSEQYDGLGRREANSAGLSFQYDGSTMIGWSETGASYNFTTLPGGGALAGSFTSGGTTTTWVPLLDPDGTTIALVNAANVQAGPVTTYTYDPAGTPTVSGAANPFWPFLYQGMEQEFFDAPYYYTGGGQFYSAQMVRSLSEAGETGTSGAGGGGGAAGNGGGGGGGPSGNPLAAPSDGGFSPNFSQSPQETGKALGVGAGAAGATAGVIFAYNTFLVGAEGASLGYATPVVVIALIGEGLFELFDDLFGGGGSDDETPRQELHGRHSVYPVILGVPDALIVDENSSVSKWIILISDDKTYALPQAFWRWYHRQIKKPGDPDLDKSEADAWYQIWEQEGEPDAEGHRTKDPKIVIVPVDPAPLPPLTDPDVVPFRIPAFEF